MSCVTGPVLGHPVVYGSILGMLPCLK